MKEKKAKIAQLKSEIQKLKKEIDLATMKLKSEQLKQSLFDSLSEEDLFITGYNFSAEPRREVTSIQDNFPKYQQTGRYHLIMTLYREPKTEENGTNSVSDPDFTEVFG